MLKNLFFFTGEESYLLHEQIAFWKDAFIKKHGDLNLISLNSEESSISEMSAAIMASPFLAERRLIFIHGLPDKPKIRQTEELSKKDEKREEELKKIEIILTQIPETSIVVLVQDQPDKRKSLYKKLMAIAEVKEFKPLSGPALNQWIIKRVSEKGSFIDEATCQHLILLADQSLWRLSKEIDKLAAYDLTVTKETINHLVTPTFEANVFYMTDALGVKDGRKAIHHLSEVIKAGENLRQTFYMIVRHFRLLIQGDGYSRLHPNSNSTAFSAALKIHPFVARTVMSQLKYFNAEELKRAYQKLLDIDVDMKTSHIRITADNQDELALAIERFIINFCHR